MLKRVLRMLYRYKTSLPRLRASMQMMMYVIVNHNAVKLKLNFMVQKDIQKK